MDPINSAVEEINSLRSGETFSYTEIAKNYGVVRSTLTRRHLGQTVPRTSKILNSRKLTQQQEVELVSYIEQLTARRLPPTREIIQNFASAIAKQPVGKSWVTRFINRNKMIITPTGPLGWIEYATKLIQLMNISYSFNFWLRKLRSTI
jgi:transcriptional regulator with XRE-family HTH domain